MSEAIASGTCEVLHDDVLLMQYLRAGLQLILSRLFIFLIQQAQAVDVLGQGGRAGVARHKGAQPIIAGPDC